MIKIIRAKEMGRIEALSYQEGASEEQFMRNAGRSITRALHTIIGQLHIEPKILFLCGKGNNGGDGFAAATQLASGGFSLQVYALHSLTESSPLCQKMRQEFCLKGRSIKEIKGVEDIDFSQSTVIVDALLGTGFHGELPLLYQQLIDAANQSQLPILSVDIPSGINGNTGERGKCAIRATKTLFLGAPKTGCFLGEAFNHLGESLIYDFGLDEKYFNQAKADYLLVTRELARNLLPPLERARHKYQAGYVVGVGGSSSMAGAPLLGSDAALHAGAGIVRLMHPAGMEIELSKAAVEVIMQPYQNAETILHEAERAKALFIGPGMGLSKEATTLLKQLLPKVSIPCVLDADCLTIIAQEKLALPRQALLTPHKGEMMRLLGVEDKTIPIEEFLSLVRAYTEKHQVTLVLKGAPTFIFHKNETPYIMAEGDPGMATAGSGDVLTGILAALLAQGNNPLEAALLGTYLHGVAGVEAAKEKSSYAMVASDITKHLSTAFKFLKK